MGNRELFFSLLRSEILGEPIEAAASEMLDTERAGALLKLAKAQDLAHILAAALLRTGVLIKDPCDEKASALKKICEREQMLAVYRYEKLAYAQKEISEIFTREKIPHVLLKGAVIRSFYPHPWHRSSCDVDILVHEEDLSRACAVLCDRAGYRVEGKKKFHDIHLYSQGGVHLELHFNLLSTYERYDAVLSRVWDFANENANNCYLFELKSAFLVFHHTAHMAYHFREGGCGIKPFLDLFIMQTRMGADFDGARVLLAEAGLLSFFENALALTDAWLFGKAHTALTLKTEKYILSGGVYGTVDNAVLAKQGRSGGRIGYALGRIFMPKETLTRTYPVLYRHPWLLPLMQVRRWLRILFGGRLFRGVRELSANQRVSKEEADAAAHFLTELGL